MKTKPCFCGEQNPRLHLHTDSGNYRPKWVFATCTTCMTWGVEYNNKYLPHYSDEAYKNAVEAWNAAQRGSEK